MKFINKAILSWAIVDFKSVYLFSGSSLVAHCLRICLPKQETQVWSLSREDPLEKETATHSSILAWEVSWTEEPGELQSMGLQKSQTRLNS